MRRHARTDAGHAAIVQALRKTGCSVLDLSRVGSGCPDLLVQVPVRWPTTLRPACTTAIVLTGYTDTTYEKPATHRLVLMEVKTPRGKLTADQKRFHALWPETVIVRSLADALAAVGIQT